MKQTFPTDTEQHIVTYVLTIMNAVQLLFKQPSLGRNVDISVVLMDILKQQPRDLASSDNIDTYLTNFCVWQHKKRLHSRGVTPRWDHALLLSGINMYVIDGLGRKKRHVVGLAPVSGMCNSLNSCTISEGTSFQTVLVAGHEMGHSLGMEHDGTQDGNSCNNDNFVMSPTLGAGKTTWSSCSKDYLDKFVRSSQASCILGSSQHINIINQFIPTDKLPGQTFTADQQCVLRFGADAKHSPMQALEDICRLVRCDVGTGRNIIAYHAHPALEGTTCGNKKLCREGRCVSQETNIKLSVYQSTTVSINTSTPIDGGWTEWSPYSSCRSECITNYNRKPLGVMISKRKCENPMPYNGGKACDGSDKKVQLCEASRICNSYSYRSIISIEDYISDTCRAAALRNSNLEQRGTQYPSYDFSHSCYVWCHKKGGGYLTQGWKIPDGSPCGGHEGNGQSYNNRYCFDGECRYFDCNGFSKSGAKHESVVNGEQCTSSSNLLYENPEDHGWGHWYPISKCRYNCQTKSKGFRLVSRDCNSISNCGPKRESFQLCDDQKDYCNNILDTPEEYANKICQKYQIKYPTLLSGLGKQLSSQTTNINSGCIVACQDRIWKDIHYQMDAFIDGKFPFGTDCSFGSAKNAYCLNGKCIKFDENNMPFDSDASGRVQVKQLVSDEYLHHNRHKRSNKMIFRKSGVQEHTDIQSENASWFSRNNWTPILPNTWSAPNPSRPILLSSSDNTNQTLSVEPYVWSISMSECDRYCGQGFRKIEVQCHVGKYRVDDSLCNANTKPVHNTIEHCNLQPCIGRWKTYEWTACTATCGRAYRTLTVFCIQNTSNNLFAIIDNKYCNLDQKPKQLQICQIPQCS
ncbi:A disintegrin and metalloproteinase with thrombospondin motifs adt-2-like [Oppia nitens]|uniref:A disintegrin and metalloproteinase with thrombospondin motifs adt-2-like n=1 Tax=Oppia nitens TaxID=1686743 RepID=UPI0023D9F842|nr:A disintegrin and metalloproteinase with thrombospondin motifs adt-2-like [Oppia nitens]